MKPLVEKLLGISRLKDIYGRTQSAQTLQAFIAQVLDEFQVEPHYPLHQMDRIPSTGPTIVVANHPYGGIEGLIMASILLNLRKDVKILANPILNVFEPLHDLFFFVEPYQTPEAYQKNIQATRHAYDWLTKGGLLAMFPSGEVSHRTWKRWEVKDPPWSTSVARMIRKTKANVVPMFFHGHNSFTFQAAGLLHPSLRTALLPREMLNKRNATIQVSFGKRITYKKIPLELKNHEVSTYLRFRTYMLENTPPTSLPAKDIDQHHATPIAAHKGTPLLNQEIDHLPAKQCLETFKAFSVYYAYPEQIPNVLHEIGRLREKTFRQVGEGTGKELDLDRYDQHYVHLFSWNNERKEMVGAYRLGRTDQILQDKGLAGLYTRQLFRYDQQFLNNLQPALELGRSFIRKQYQKEFTSLLMLWKGIAKFIALHPQYKTLYGTVSISNDYSPLSKQLIMNFIQKKRFNQDLARLIKAIKPPRTKLKLPEINSDALDAFVREIEDISDLISDFDTQYEGVPILLKHYLKLGGQVVGFNIDKDFQNVVDAMIVVKLNQTDPKLLKFYMGKEAYQHYEKAVQAKESKFGA